MSNLKKPRVLFVPNMFIGAEGIGLGDFLKSTISKIGIKPCSGCSKRAEKLNKVITLKVRAKK